MFSNAKLYPSIKIKKSQKKLSTVRMLNVDKFLYCMPKQYFPRCVALELDALQIDTPCVPVFKRKAFPIHKEPEEIINSKDA